MNLEYKDRVEVRKFKKEGIFKKKILWVFGGKFFVPYHL